MTLAYSSIFRRQNARQPRDIRGDGPLTSFSRRGLAASSATHEERREAAAAKRDQDDNLASGELFQSKRGPAAFTLIELLVVIGIIVVLVGLTIPAVIHARNTGAKTAQKIEFQAIATGLEAYRQDQGEYPPVTYQDSGSEVLGRALMGPGPAASGLGSAPYSVGQFAALSPNTGPYFVCVQATSSSPAAGDAHWQELTIPYADGYDGPGFRLRAQGKVYGPYLDPSKFRLRGLQILDHWNNPILYFPTNTTRPNISVKNATTYVANNLGTYPYLAEMPTAVDANNNNVNNGANKPTFTSLFDAGDNISAFVRSGESAITLPPYNAPALSPAFERIAIFFGDYTPHSPGTMTPAATDFNGVADAGETPVTLPYVLWSAGVDGFYGITTLSPLPTANDILKCDDITNITP